MTYAINDLFEENDSSNKSKEILKRRAIASTIDYVILFLFTLVLPVLIGEKTEKGYKIHGFLALTPLFFWIVYFIVIEKYFSSTLGKYLVGIKVVSEDGSRVSFGQQILRRIADFIEIIWCFGIVAYVNASNNHNNKRVGDIWANTKVINR